MYATLTTPYETIVVERAGSVAFLTLDRPAVRNAMNMQMVDEICCFFDRIRDDRTIRCVVLRGAGGTFCAGADIKELADPDYQSWEARQRYARELDAMLQAVLHAPQVTVAVVEGAAMGGGFGLVSVADFAIATPDAVMSLPEVRLGLAPAVISPYLIDRIGLTRARQLALTGRKLDGAAALELGVVQEVAEGEALDSVLRQTISEILEGSPEALAATKELLFTVARAPSPASTLDYRVETLSRLRTSEDGLEGMAAFAEKRSPRWSVFDEPLSV